MLEGGFYQLLGLVFIDDDSWSPQSTAGIPNHVLSSRGYFFDNPRRYDSDDDLAWSIPPQNASARYEHINNELTCTSRQLNVALCLMDRHETGLSTSVLQLLKMELISVI